MKTFSQRRLLHFFTSFIIIFAVNQFTFAQEPASVSYGWKSVQMVGGGFVDGIVFHPAEKGLCYCRTDMGGAYRRNPKTLRWEPLLDWVSYKDVNLMGVESIALDPSDPNRLFMSCGTYTNDRAPNGAILRSDDRGKTFQRTDVPFKMGGNEDGRGNGERMAVDPNDGKILYLGTRHDGLWKSTDRAVTWNQVKTFPDITENPPDTMKNERNIMRWRYTNQGSGVIFVLFDPNSGSSGKGSSTIYAGVSLRNHENIFRSTDAGNTWQALPNQPIQNRPTHAVLASDGNLFITYGNAPGPSRMTDGGVWKLNTKTGEWTYITPDKPDKTRQFGYAAVSVDAHNPNVIIVSSFNRYGIEKGDEIFRSLDSGKTWNKVFAGGALFNYSLAPYVKRTGVHWMFDIEIDPFNSNHAMFTTGYGGHETFDLTDMGKGKPTKWTVMSTGVEETVALELLSPTKGAPLITAIGDYGGFVHWNLDKPAPEGNFDHPHFGNTNGIACGSKNPEVIVRVGRASNNKSGENIGYSTNGGKTWQPTATMPTPESSLGYIAVSSDGATWIWAPSPVRGGFGQGRQAPKMIPVYFTSDKGANWTECKGIPGNTRVIADAVNPNKFYAISLFEGKLFVSNDKGANFTEQVLDLPGGSPNRVGNRGDNRGGQDRIYASPDQEGDLWIAAFDGLYHSTDAGKRFVKLDQVQEIHAFGFGKAASKADYPAIYQVGIVDGIRGIFRSTDEAKSWVRINDDQHQWGLILHITGDPKKFGRVYVGTHGRGTIYGDPTK